MRREIVALVVLLLVFWWQTGLSSSDEGAVAVAPLAGDTYLDQLNLPFEELGPLHTTFLLRFAGQTDWSYQVDTRSDGDAMEYSLHIEGLSGQQNPGDVRLVNAGGINQMRGPGTDDVCVQFPDELDLNVSFLDLSDIINLGELSKPTETSEEETIITPDELFKPTETSEEETIAGRAATRYDAFQESMGRWQNAEISYWLDNETGTILRFDFSMDGSDSLYDKGRGSFTGEFIVIEVGPQEIEPVAGCEINLPLAEDATNLVVLPGLISYASEIDMQELVDFYHEELTDAGWERFDLPQTGTSGEVVLSYVNSTQTLDINLESAEGGVSVELFLGER